MRKIDIQKKKKDKQAKKAFSLNLYIKETWHEKSPAKVFFFSRICQSRLKLFFWNKLCQLPLLRLSHVLVLENNVITLMRPVSVFMPLFHFSISPDPIHNGITLIGVLWILKTWLSVHIHFVCRMVTAHSATCPCEDSVSFTASRFQLGVRHCSCNESTSLSLILQPSGSAHRQLSVDSVSHTALLMRHACGYTGPPSTTTLMSLLAGL